MDVDSPPLENTPGQRRAPLLSCHAPGRMMFGYRALIDTQNSRNDASESFRDRYRSLIAEILLPFGVLGKPQLYAERFLHLLDGAAYAEGTRGCILLYDRQPVLL